ncbi:hypothetical protein P4B35_03020 [Pontiellaceae bacterium B12227]|nr:hypothetical protein [Pontiellaceae bacterium B12227]
MKVWKNILLIVALLYVALPCTHADRHHHASPFSELPDQISAVHTCECHSCDSNTVCTEPLEVDQNLSVCSADAPAPASMIQLFVLNQTRPAFTPAAPPVHGPPPGLRTIQLLI